MSLFGKTVVVVCVASCLFGHTICNAASFPLPGDESHVVGYPESVVAGKDDTFSSIAMQYKVGFDALAAANPKYWHCLEPLVAGHVADSIRVAGLIPEIEVVVGDCVKCGAYLDTLLSTVMFRGQA